MAKGVHSLKIPSAPAFPFRRRKLSADNFLKESNPNPNANFPMKNLILFAFLLLPWAAFAQAAQHSATLTWGASTTTGVSYHVYRAACTDTITGGVCSQAGTYSII